MSEQPIFPINYLEYREYVDYENKRGKHQIINEWKTIKTFAKAFGTDAKLWGIYTTKPTKSKSQTNTTTTNSTQTTTQQILNKQIRKCTRNSYSISHRLRVSQEVNES
jgi:flagellar biosynthesis/type III secretory pathway M-ring protein FliF/YscJ